MRRLFLFATVVTLLTAGATAPSRGGSYGTELSFAAGSGARAAGMGLATSSVPGLPSFLYFNPALMARAQYGELEFFRTTLFDSDARFHAASYVHPTLDFGTFGASVLRVGVGGVEERDELNNLLDDDLNNSQTRVLLGYAADIHPMVSAGVNLKVDRQSFGDYAGTGMGADVGVLVHRAFSGYALLEEWRVALAVENVIEPSVKLDQEDVADPMKVTLGASVDGRHRDFSFTTALDVVNGRSAPVRARFGEEIGYGGLFALRFGVDGSTPTVGFGGHYRTVSLDYAYRDEELGGNHRVSLAVAFGPSREQRRHDRRTVLDAQLQDRVAEKMKEYEGAQVRALLAEADSLFDAGVYDRALGQYEMALLWDPSLAPVDRRIHACRRSISIREADALAARGDHLGALHHLKQALLNAPNDAEIAAKMADCERRIDAAKDRSRMVENRLTASIELYAQDRLFEARMGFAEVLRIDAGNPIATEYEGKCAAAIDNGVRRLLARARDEAARGDHAAALASLDRGLAYRPDDKTLLSEIVVVREKRRTREAAAASESARPAPAPGAADRADLDEKYGAGLRYFEAGRFEDAARVLSHVWSVDPGYRDAADLLARSYLYMGMKVYSQGQYTEAIRIWERALAVDPDNVKAIRYLEKTRQEVDKLSGADHD